MSTSCLMDNVSQRRSVTVMNGDLELKRTTAGLYKSKLFMMNKKTIDMQASQPILLVNSRLAKGCSSLVAEDGGCRRGGDAIHLRSCKERI